MTQPLPCRPLARQIEDQPTYGTLSPRMRKVAEEGWAKFLARAAGGDEDQHERAEDNGDRP
ncbi:hypothetical protein ACFXDJ_06770 [Streptomyces sp. NPDC059443]|uniref:hypothetical protein n=1 Tax=unclassified Streptomyces TaxID=2593676 RepID=UPI0036A4CF7C